MNSGTGACTVLANQTGNSNYNAAPQKSAAATATKLDQTITLSGVPTSEPYQGTFTPAATSTSGLTVSLSIDPASSTVCSLSSGTVTMNSGTGACTVLANQTGNSNYNAAPQKSAAATATKLDQTITLSGVPTSEPYQGTFTPAATSTSGLTVSLSIDPASSTVCSLSSGTVTMNSGTGACTGLANQTGNSNYNAAPQKSAAATATKLDQTITLSGVPTSEPYQGTFTPAATSTSGLTVSLSIDPASSTVCSLSSGTVTMNSGTGACTVLANQTGNSNYNAAPQKSAAATATKIDQTITLSGVPTSQPYQGTFTPAATSTS